MDDLLLAAAVPDLVLGGWGRKVGSIRPWGGGMNSATAMVELDDGLFVAKWVPGSSAKSLDSGSKAARRLALGGLASGEPLETLGGRLSWPALDGAVALLRFVRGESLTGEGVEDQVRMALTLAQVHAMEADQQSAPFMVTDIAELVHDVEPWVRPAVTAVLDEHARLPELTWGILHTDPAPEAFLYDEETGEVGLIDWTGSVRGPVLYDVASALMYLGGPDRAEAFLRVYAHNGPASASELIHHLDAFRRLRAAVQAAYFSMRIATADLTGIDHQDENWRGLRDAEALLTETGVL